MSSTIGMRLKMYRDEFVARSKRIISVLWGVAEPHRAVAYALHALQVEQDGICLFVLDAVEYTRHSFPSVDARTYHHADFVKQSCCQECPVYVSASHQCDAFYAEMFTGKLHGPVQVDVLFSGGNPGNARRVQIIRVGFRTTFRHDYQQRFPSMVFPE